MGEEGRAGPGRRAGRAGAWAHVLLGCGGFFWERVSHQSLFEVVAFSSGIACSLQPSWAALRFLLGAGLAPDLTEASPVSPGRGCVQVLWADVVMLSPGTGD